MSASLTLLKVSASPSARSLISSESVTSFSKSTSPFSSSLRRSSRSSSIPSVSSVASLSDAIVRPPFLLPLQSRDRSRPPEPGNSEQVAERPEVQVQIRPLQPELGDQLVHSLLETHERLPEPVDLVVGERTVLHALQGLPLHQLPQKLDEREDELRETPLDRLRIRVDPAGERTPCTFEVTGQHLQVPVREEESITAHGPSCKLAKL